MKIITALGNEEINLKLKENIELEIIGKDIQYQEAVIEILEESENVDLLILSSILPGELNIKEFVNIIKYKNPNIEIFIIVEKEDEKLKEFFISKGINNIYYNNKITFNEILEKINEINNKNIINTKINNLEEIILKKNNKNNILKIYNKIKYLKKIIKNKNKLINKKNNKKIIAIIGAKKIGKTIFSLILGLNIKNKKILIIDSNSEKNNMKIIIGKKVKNELISWRKNIDILLLKNLKDKEQLETIMKYIEKYDYIILDLDYVFEKEFIIKKADEIVLLVEPNLLGLKETRDILEEVINKQKNHKDNIKIVFNKQCDTTINSVILKKIFSDFKIIGNIQYDKNYNMFINTNGKIITNKIKDDYLKIIKKII